MKEILDLLKCSKEQLPAKLKEFRIKLGTDPIDFCRAINIRDSAMYTMAEEGLVPIVNFLLSDEKILPSLLTLLQKNSQFLNGSTSIEDRFDALDRLLEQQRETNQQMDTQFVQLALEAIKSNDIDALQRLIGVAVSNDSEYLPFLMAAQREGNFSDKGL
jgi:hypothetical protein